jgi:hypothetical protein
MPHIRKFALLIAALSSVFVFAACGDDGGSEDEDQITEAIEFAATSGDPAACTEAQTAKFNQQTSGDPGDTPEQATQSCEANAGDTPAEEADVSAIEVDGEAATAEAALTGSTFNGQTLDIALVKEGDDWKLDEITGFAEFDREAFNTAFREELASDGETPPEAVDCVIGNFDELSDEDVQAFFLGEISEEQAGQIFGPCFPGE